MRLRRIDRRLRPDPDDGPFADGKALEQLVRPLGRADWVANLVLVDDDEMSILNGEYRRTGGVTDVLSFSYLLTAGEGEPDLPADERGAACDLWLDDLQGVDDGEGGRQAGELVLAPGFVTGRCLEHGWPVEHEAPLLVVHGCLHLLGWGHETEALRRRMQQREAELLATANLPHPLLDAAGDGPGS